MLASISCPGADLVTLRFVHEEGCARRVRDGNLTDNSFLSSRGVMVEVLFKGSLAWAASPDVSERGVGQAALRALDLASSMKDRGVCRFDPSVRPPSVGSYSSKATEPYNSSDRNLGSVLNDLLINACLALKVSPKIASTGSWLNLSRRHHHLVSTAGADVEQSFFFAGHGYQATAIEGGTVQTRSWEERGQSGLELLVDRGLPQRLSLVGAQAVELLGAEECPSETTDLILLPDQMILQIHESIGHPLEIDRILGDERNYAGSSFVKLEDFGTLEYGTPLLNVSFDPTVEGQFASYGFDDNGKAAEREWLIHKGKLLRGLGGAESEFRAGMPGVACSRASSWNRPPIDRMGNVNLEPGESSLEEMIAGVERGILMETNRSWSIDDFRRKFQFGCEYAKLIEKGKLTRTLRNPNYRGSTLSFWHGLKNVGDKSTHKIMGVPYCGKGEPNQGMWVGHASPACLFEKVEVFGGAS